MHLTRSRLGWPFYLVLVMCVAAGFAALDPTFDRSPGSKIRSSISEALIANIQLSNASSHSVTEIAGNILEKTFGGTFPTPIEEIELHVKFKHLRSMKEERERAVAIGLLWEPEYYPARIVFDGETYDAKIRLKGDLTDHWEAPKRWSLRVRLKGGRTIMGMNQFSLHKPRSRQLPFDHLFERWMTLVGNLAPRHGYASIRFNGDDWGVMNVEEHTTKFLLEDRHRKEAPIAKIGSQESWFHKRLNEGLEWGGGFHGRYNSFSLHDDGKYADDPTQLKRFAYAEAAYRGVLSGEVDVDDVYDIDRFSMAIIAAAAWGNYHGVHMQNMKLAVNPYTLRLEPITTDQGAILSIRAGDVHWFESPPPEVIRDVLTSRAFKERFRANLVALKDAAERLDEEYAKICGIFPYDCPAAFLDVLHENLEVIEHEGATMFVRWAEITPKPREPFEQRSSPPDARFNSHILGEYFDDGRLVIWNNMREDIILERVSLRCESRAACEGRVLYEGPLDIEAGDDGVFQKRTTLRLAPGIVLNRDAEMTIRTRRGAEVLDQLVEFTRPSDQFNPFLDIEPVDRMPNDQRPAFVRVEGDRVILSAGDWLLDKPLHVSADASLHIEPGTTLSFAEGAYILCEGPLIAEGELEHPIVLAAQDDGVGWRGVFVAEADGRSRLRHVTISDTRALESGILVLTGAVTFYKSDVDMSEIVFDGTLAEDALNIVHSDFNISSARFEGVRSDAFDSDFSTGKIEDASFARIGGDGLDTSGSQVSGKNLDFKGVGDKAVSVGEASTVILESVVARDVGAAVVSKDGSRLNVLGLQADNTALFTAMAYVKKESYGSAWLSVESGSIGEADVFNQIGNTLVLNGQMVPGQDLDVDGLYETGPMQKQ